MASYGRASYPETKTAETLLFRSHRFEALQEYAHCSAASIIQLACVVALKAYASVESINFLGEDQKWLLWNTPLSPKSRIFELLCKPKVASADSVTISKANLTEYALIVSSFRDGCPLNMAQEALPSLHAVKAVHPQTVMAFTAGQDPLSHSLLVRCEYSETTHSDWRARKILSTFRNALESIIAQPNANLCDLDLLDEGDHHQYDVWNQLDSDHEKVSVQDMIESHVHGSPLNIAVDAWDGTLSYAELDEKSSNIANELVRRGVRAESKVALLFEKSVWNIVATLAVLKTGGAFVPLDPFQPDGRISNLLDKIQPKTVLSSKTYTERLRALSRNILCVEEQSTQQLFGLATASFPSPRPWDLAYIMFTSGSTGEPKGVMVDNAACSSSIAAHGRATGFNRQTRVIQYARHTFDASIAEILTTLSFGGCIVIPSEDERLNDITSVMQLKRVNWAFFTPSVIRLLEPSELPGLTTLLLGGEAVGQDNIEKWGRGRNLINAFGPTENTVFSTMHLVRSNGNPGVIGRGVGTFCWIVVPDDPTRLSPLGAVGELVLEGPQLARGYLNFEEGEGPNNAFVRDPPWLAKHNRRGRLYRTGDLCRFDQNGVIHFEGRKDTQLKISGQRLEASEVEYHLRSAFKTQSVVVDVVTRPTYGSKKNAKVLVAFICQQGNAESDSVDGRCVMPRQIPALRKMIPKVEAMISSVLPSWMCPSLYIPLFSLPLTANGKVDLKRLRREVDDLRPEQFYGFSELGLEDETEEAANENTELQNVMRGLWAGVLGISEGMLSASSNFLRLGGDSMAVISLVSAARKSGLALEFAQVFKNPTLGDLCQLPLLQSKKSMITTRPMELLDGESVALTEIAEECSIIIEDIEDAFPCTPLQEGLMAMSSTTANSFLVQYVLQIGADVDVASLKNAWNLVSKAHGILRTRLVDTSTSGIQQVVVHEALRWNESSNLDEYLDFDLKKASTFGVPLNRFGIIYDTNGLASSMVWTVHHAIVDGHSVGLTLRAVRDAFRNSFEATKASFSSFIKYSQTSASELSTQYWKSVFEGGEYEQFPRKPPCFFSANANPEKAFVRLNMALPTSGLDVTATTILRAAWALVISRFSGSSNAVFGVTSSGRNASFDGIETVMGPVIATVPLRVKCDRSRTVIDFLTGLQTATIDMIPFEQMGIQNISRIDANCKAACEFQSMMIIQPEVDMAMDGAPFTAFERPQDLDKFNSHAVMVECSLQETSVHVNFNYDTEYLDHSQASRLVDYFDTALGFLVASQTTRLETFFAQPSAEDIKQMQAWNQKPPYITEACVHQLFATQAQIQPSAQAIFSWDGHLSFLELDKKASQLARVLVDLGVGPESKVVYCFEKSLYTVVSMLAILKAGGAMVPLDPVYPLERKSFIVQNVAAKVVVVSSSQADSFSGSDTPVVIVNRALFENMDKLHVQAFSSAEVQPHHAATVLFTSGSTGLPKGVVQEHRTLCSAANAQSAGMQMFKGSRILQFSAHVFDVSVIEIVNALVLGACICIPSDEDRLNNLAGFVTESQADWAFFTPSFARTLDPGDLPSLKTVCMGGEAMTVDNIETWASRVQLINAYGPCEGSVCTVTQMSNVEFPVGDSIGHGLNCHVWIVDPDTHEILLPIGSIGEILIDGPSVARGYLGDPEKTSKSFIADPSWTSNFNFGEESRRMYKTGDLGRFNSDGSVSYLGRKDTQIKLRGQRIELGEIEHRLIEILPAGSLVAVDVLSLSRSSSKHLVAFIQLGGLFDNFSERKNAVDDMTSQLKTRLLSVLPIYMVPSHFQCLESLPFGTTGKLDRRRLKEYAANLDTLHGLGSAPNEGEFGDFEFGGSLLPDEDIALSISNKLAELLSRNGPERKQSLRGSNFIPFYAGMDSVQVVSLSTFVRKTYGTSLPIKKYMNSTATIRDIARWIAEDRQILKQDDGLELLDEIEKYDKSLPALRPLDTAWNENFSPKAVFLTGATGFLGNQLLCQLLERPGVSKVVTLVRGSTAAHATERLFSLARGSSWWREAYTCRIEVWHGDLSLPHLGLEDTQWSRLDGSGTEDDLIDAVVHNGAVVNWMADYHALVPANTLSTVQLLTAVARACASRPVRFTYVSGGHLSTSPDNVNEVAEELKSYPAYSQTKFVSEILVARFAQRLAQAGHGSLVSIVKPGLIMGSSSDGISNTDDFLWRVTASALDIGLRVDEDPGSWIAAAGVDLVAKIILDSCLLQPAGCGASVSKKILSGISLSDYWDIVAEETGRVTEPSDAKQWLGALQCEVEGKGSGHRMWPVMHFVEDKGGILGQPLGAMTAEDQAEHQAVVRKALRKSLQYLVAIGYMNISRTSSEDGDNASESGVVVPGSLVFSRTPTTPIWNQTTDPTRLGYGDHSEQKLELPVTGAPRSPSPLCDSIRGR
ncbi:Nonribosomal peptide synthase atnA [Colletotrichum siamense]|nr:Nonribosomal peptide synthase atnA [Colletotrichum siamense]